MRPEDETPEVPRDDSESSWPDELDLGESVPPATWAGRRRAGGEEEAPPQSDETEQFDAVGDEPEEYEAAEPEVEDSAAVQEPEPVGEPEAVEEPKPEAFEEPEPTAAEEPVAVEEPEADADEPVAGATVEADTLSLADREAAQEAALAGLRARTGEQPVEVEADEADAEPVAADDGEPEPVGVVAAVAADDGDKAPRAKRVWPRFLAASFVIISSIAAATAISVLVVLTDFARGLGGIAGVAERLDAVEGGAPQTILILGSDKRPDEGPGRSDTTILLRVNPDNDSLNLLSIPRDLKANIPGYGIDKFNAAYSYGGPALTLETVKQLTGLDVHHVVNINFSGFADAVNAIGCVFIDIDRRYFVPEGSGYSAIDPPIEPGYQKVCGLKALQYVRFRFDDTDIVRAARQQDFVREARQKISPARLAFEADYRNELLDVFKEYTTSDDKLKDPSEVIELMKTFIAARTAGLNEVHFPAELGDADSIYVTADDDEIKKTVEQFLGTGGTPGPQEGGDDKPQRERDAGAGPKPDKPEPKPEPPPEPQGPAMFNSSGVAEQAADRIAESERSDGKPYVRFPIYYPTRLTAASEGIDEVSRAFVIDGPTKYFGYKFVVPFQLSTTSYREYYGVSGTNWEDPPILENPSETRTIDGRDYLIFYDGDRVRLVGFKEDKKSYWVHNSLLQTLTEEEMLSVATSLRERGG